MSEKARDSHGRWRSKTIAFRISPEENALLEDFVRLSGISKQTYIIQRVLNREVVVTPNPRVHRALKGKMEQLCEQLRKLRSTSELSPEILAELEILGRIYEGMSMSK